MKNNTFKKWLTLSALFAFMCFSPHGLLRAQSTANYAFSTNTTGSLGLDMNSNTVDMSTGTTQVLATNTSQDQAINGTTIAFPAGFEFFMGGNRFTSYFATSNGIIQLGSTAVISGTTYTAGGGTLAAPRITAFDGDLGTGTTGGVFGKLIGSAPNRCYVIEFRNMSLMWTSAYPNNGTYQVRFYEGTGVVEYVYGTMVCGSTASAGDATPEVGFSWGGSVNQSASINISTSAVDLSGTMVQNTITAGNITNLNSAAEGSRRVYRFTPPAPAAPSGLSFSSVGTSYMNLNWTDNASNEVGYAIYRSLDGINYTYVSTIPANSSSYTATGLSANTLYYWNVYAVSEGVLSSPVLSGNQSTIPCSTISGIKTVGLGGDYPNLSFAFADINGCSLAGNTELQLIAGYPAVAESYPITGPATTPVGAFTLKVYPMVSGLSITSANASGTLNLNNSFNVTIDGRVNQAGANDLVISNTGTGYAVQFVNDAKSNVLQYLTIQSSNTSTSSGTIVFAGSTGTTGNDNNTIDHCDIKDGAATPLNGIYSAGTSTTIDNSGNIVSNSNIYNYFGAASASNGILLSSNSSGWTINGNKFYQTGTRTSTSGNTHRAINIITSSGNGYIITNNVIGYASSAATGVTTYAGAFANRFTGIEITASTTGTASSVQANTVTGISLSTTSGATAAPGILGGISVLGGTVSVGNVTPNIIGGATGTGAIAVTTSTSANVFGIHATSTGTLIVSNNTVGSINAAGSAAGVSCGIVGINTAGASTATTVSGNTIGSTTANSIASGTAGVTTAATTVSGIATAGASTSLTVSGNTINNLTNYSSSTSSALNGIVSSGSPVSAVISNNTVSNTSLVSGTLTNISTASPTTLTVSGNTLFNASGSGTTATINGISTSGAVTGLIFKNKIYNLNAVGATSAVNGILASGGAAVNIYNNVIGDLKTPTTSAADPVRGISITSTSATTVYRVYYNSIYLNASSSGTNFGTTGVYHTVNATATTAALDMRNNIIINESTPAGTGITVAFRRSGTALGNFASTSNRNLLYAGTPSATNLLMYDGTNPYQTMIAYQTAVAPREVNSFTGEAAFTGAGYGTAGNFFMSTTPSSANYLKPVAAITTQVESGAINITTPSITDDYASIVRQGNAGYTGTGTSPDLGAFEFEGTTPAPVIVLNSVTPPASTQCVSTPRLVSVNITTSAGTVTGATIGYTVNGVPQSNIAMTNVSGTTWTGTIPVPTPSNAAITWGVAASNSIGLNSSYTGTPYADEPLFGATASATASSSTVCASSPSVLTAKLVKSGPVTIGTGSTVSTGSAAQTPFYGGYGGVKTQYLIRASELTALGLNAGNITQMSLNITGAGSTLNGFGISMDHTALTALTSNIENIATQVYSTPSFVPTVGANNFVFSTPFNWDGTSNVIVSFCWSNNNTSNTASNLTIVSTAYVSANARYVDSRTAAEVCGYTGNTTPGGWNGAATTLSSRPIFTFIGNATQTISSVSWSDGVGTVGTTNPLSVSPTATTTYTATITAAGCPVTPAPTTTVTVNPLPSSPTATNSAQCGVQIPTASVTSTSGLPTPTFNWYAASSGGTALQSSTSATFTSTVSTTTTFYVSELNTVTGCESTRTPVTVNVSTPDAVSLTPSVPAICIGGSFTLTAANTNGTPFQSYTYSTVSTTGSGLETPTAGASLSVTPTTAGSYTYTLTATDGGCAASATATVVVNALPVIASATATPATVCSGSPITLTGNVTTSGVTSAALGTSTTTEFGGGVYRNGFGTGDFRHQLLYTAAEMTAAGFTAGNITSLTFNVSSAGSGSANNYTIKLANVPTAGPLTATFATGTFTTVYSAATYTAVGGNNTHTFSSPFMWDGTSNILVDICYNISAVGGSSTLSATTPAVVSNTNLLGSAGACAATGGGTTFANRPLIAFTMNYASNFNWLWSPGAFTTPVATTSITNTSGSAMNQAFTVTVTNPTTGCAASTTTSSVTINPATVAPIATNSAHCGTMTPTASVTGTGTPGNTFLWYTVPTGGTAIAGQTGSSLSAFPVSTTTTFYVSENNGTCSSARTPVTVTVTPAPTISISGAAAVCNGSSTSLTVTSSNDPNYTYTWSGGLGTGATVSAAPTVGTTYTVTATDASGGANNGCVTSATHTIAVNPVPASAPIVPATATICAGSVQNLTSGPVVTTGTAIIGNGTTAPGTTSFPNPLSAYYGGTKHQILFTAAELTAQGMTAGSQISTVTFDLNAFAGNACTNFTIRMGNTALTALTGFVGGTSTVYGPTTFTPTATGLVTFTLVTPYTWNGTSNIVVETVHNAGNGGNGSGTRTNTTTTASNTVFYGSSDNIAGGIAGFDALSTWGTSGASNLRPNMRFAFSSPMSGSWTPAATLYTNPGATTPYVGGALASSVYAKPMTTTTYVVTYTGSNGCTSQSSATVTVNQPSSSSVSATACDTYTWAQNSTTYTTSGAYTAVVPNAAGCDSTITLNLTIKNSTSATVAHTACDTYTWPINSTTYTTSGTHTATIPNAAGCDSTITLNLTINNSTSATVNQTACQTYTWPINSQTYTTSGVYTATIANAAGCDSVITLNLTIGGPSASLVPVTACVSYVWPQTGLTYTASGAYNDTIPNMFGCDSVITLSLTINQPTSSSVTATACTSYTWAENGTTYTTSGAYTHVIPNAAGCDSTITLNLTIIQPTTSSVSATACTSYTWAQNGMTYTASGAYNDTIPNAAGCDSIITLNLTINSVTTSTVTISTCNPTYTWAQNGMVYNATGMYNDTITNAAGCDSIVTLNLTIAPFVATATDNGNATITASTGTTYQWINCTTNTVIAGAITQTFTATANGTYAAIVSNGTCSDTTNCVNITNVGIKENTISTISVHPNPTHDFVIVTMEDASAVVEVMDVQGKLVQTAQIKSGDQIDLGAYERGVYTLRIKTESGTSIERIVKN
ncbi:MAG: T9SS type A sorting domain-containing protein [Fluviicola sp.]